MYKKQRAVEWLWTWINDNQEATIEQSNEAYKQAKEMEKKQITDAYTIGRYQQRIDEFVEINDIVLKDLKKD